ncbi:hypothetical protein CEXT_786941 [Caerostris extrusa]|uniref:Uncharacterized protein n=1 Tax=Caerostris extrusa TaxID=172846 RepID=A0AAV4Y8P8_CAEEX|nr:hypothetical protein CEXT_786941 [Caerostris extrusa]
MHVLHPAIRTSTIKMTSRNLRTSICNRCKLCTIEIEGESRETLRVVPEGHPDNQQRGEEGTTDGEEHSGSLVEFIAAEGGPSLKLVLGMVSNIERKGLRRARAIKKN